MYNHWFWRSLFFSEMYVLVLHRKTLQISSRKVFFKNFKNQIHFILYVNWNYFSRLRWNVIISLNNAVWDQEVPAIYHLKLDYLSNCSKKKGFFFDEMKSKIVLIHNCPAVTIFKFEKLTYNHLFSVLHFYTPWKHLSREGTET